MQTNSGNHCVDDDRSFLPAIVRLINAGGYSVIGLVSCDPVPNARIVLSSENELRNHDTNSIC